MHISPVAPRLIPSKSNARQRSGFDALLPRSVRSSRKEDHYQQSELLIFPVPPHPPSHRRCMLSYPAPPPGLCDSDKVYLEAQPTHWHAAAKRRSARRCPRAPPRSAGRQQLEHAPFFPFFLASLPRRAWPPGPGPSCAAFQAKKLWGWMKTTSTSPPHDAVSHTHTPINQPAARRPAPPRPVVGSFILVPLTTFIPSHRQPTAGCHRPSTQPPTPQRLTYSINLNA